jgi:tetratricopeptide (TPR) repeat protein
MTATPESTLCPNIALSSLLNVLQKDDATGLRDLEAQLKTYPLDPRLHFLRGSVLAGLQRYDEGRASMARSLEIAPDFTLARFQLGFLDLTSGRAVDAIGVWNPLFNLAEDEPLRVLAEGLTRMAGDDFDQAIQLIKRGMTLNSEHPLINDDMQLILDEIAEKPAPMDGEKHIAPSSDEITPAPASAVRQLLRHYELRDGGKQTKH